jgi:MoaA/NifB/PqqE/SkfB family radical SAM enzyme
MKMKRNAREEILDEELTLLHGLPRFDIEVSLKCNINCVMCPRDKITRRKSMMSPGLMDVLVDWLPGMESEIFFCGLGEPLLNPNIYGCMAKLHKRKNITGITSNGLLLTPETVHRLIDAEVNFIHVSFPSLNKEIYEGMMKGSLFETVLGHLKYLSEVKPKEIAVELAFTEQPENAGEIEIVKAFARELDFGFQHNVLHTRGGHLNRGYKTDTRGGPEACAVFAGNHFITGEGDILACCHDLEGKTVLGNIKDISFTALLEIKKSRIIKNRWFPLCSKCDDINRFKMRR